MTQPATRLWTPGADGMPANTACKVDAIAWRAGFPVAQALYAGAGQHVPAFGLGMFDVAQLGKLDLGDALRLLHTRNPVRYCRAGPAGMPQTRGSAAQPRL
jgi:predicted alpha/beta hydrolase